MGSCGNVELFLKELYSFISQDKEDTPSFNLRAKESSKEEEVMAICKLRGVDSSAPVSHHLKALDQEYHHLVESKQSAKADHVQALYAWYSKKLSQVCHQKMFPSLPKNIQL